MSLSVFCLYDYIYNSVRESKKYYYARLSKDAIEQKINFFQVQVFVIVAMSLRTNSDSNFSGSRRLRIILINVNFFIKLPSKTK